MRRCFALIGCVTILACSPDTSPPPDAPQTAALDVVTIPSSALQNAGIAVHPAGKGRLVSRLVLPGNVRLPVAGVAEIAARVSGVLTEVTKKPGDYVSEGDVVAVVSSRELGESKLAYLESEHRMVFAKKALEREQKLREKKISAEEDYLKRVHAVEESRLDHASALQRLRLLGITEDYLHSIVEKPELDHSRYEIPSPYTGTLIRRSVTLGQPVTATTLLFTLADLRVLAVEWSSPVRFLPWLREDATVKVVSPDVDLAVEARISHVSPEVDEVTRTVKVTLSLPNLEGRWRPGMNVLVELVHEEAEVPVAVPTEAVQVSGERVLVFVRTAQTSFSVRDVVIGRRGDHLTEVQSGVAAGDEVVVGGGAVLKAVLLGAEGE